MPGVSLRKQNEDFLSNAKSLRKQNEYFLSNAKSKLNINIAVKRNAAFRSFHQCINSGQLLHIPELEGWQRTIWHKKLRRKAQY